jgi:hypothetical protein
VEAPAAERRDLDKNQKENQKYPLIESRRHFGYIKIDSRLIFEVRSYKLAISGRFALSELRLHGSQRRAARGQKQD